MITAVFTDSQKDQEHTAIDFRNKCGRGMQLNYVICFVSYDFIRNGTYLMDYRMSVTNAAPGIHIAHF